ncbi:NAD(P)H-quinone oxidoreductase [Demequina aurantiaca]|uniref:NAD(P)H-quinone oxidoreductase n=1 Tax=Demequina aurantiaca TaxID=676200 RepID=UPI0022A8F71B|nr:NAD(P)H-quinone oxidoreductase [Demequina aurantiaca]
MASLPQFGAPEVFALVNMPAPAAGAHEVVINVTASGINRADVLQRQGHYPPPADAPDWPGLEVSGHVASVGAEVTRWAPGDPVCALLAGGGYAEAVAVDQDLVLPAPVGVDLVDAGGLVESACTVWSNLEAASARSGETLLVHGGAGGIGTMAIQWARAIGMQVIATAGGPERAQACLDLGAHHAIDYRSQDFVAEVNTRGGADVILDVVGAAYLERNLAALRADGRLVVIGMQKGSVGEINLGTMLAKRLSVIATSLRSRPHAQKAAIVRGVERELWPLIPTDVRPVTHARFALDDVAEAHRAMDAGGVRGKLLLIP